MSYAERLNGFNQAISSTNDHVKALRDAMNNPAIRDNPVKMALETAGQVTGTIGGVTGGVARVRDSAVMRNVQKAFYDKLTQAKKAGAPQSVIDAIQGKLDKAIGKAPTGSTTPGAPSSNGAHNADNGNSGGTEAPSDLGPGGTETGLGPGGTESGLGPGGTEAPTGGGGGGGAAAGADEGTLGGDLPFQVGAEEGFQATARVAPQDLIQTRLASGAVKPPSGGAGAGGAPELGPGGTEAPTLGPGGTEAPKSVSEFARATEGGEGDIRGLGIRAIDQSKFDPLFPPEAPPSAAAAADSSSGGASAGAGANSNSVARSAVPEDGLQPDLPFQAGGIEPNTGNPSSDAHALSQQQGSNASTHANASDPSQQATQTNLDPEAQIQANKSSAQGDSNAADAGNINADANAGSNGANVAEDAGKGIRTATKVEEGLDELAPDTGPLAPFIEIGSLLATLGTSIAGLFEKKDKTTAPTGPKPGASMALSVGANLKQGGGGGSVGAF